MKDADARILNMRLKGFRRRLVSMSLTEEERQVIIDVLKPIFQEIREKIADMVATWVSENLPRLLKEMEEEGKSGEKN